VIRHEFLKRKSNIKNTFFCFSRKFKFNNNQINARYANEHLLPQVSATALVRSAGLREEMANLRATDQLYSI
jgi:hypothetical protein